MNCYHKCEHISEEYCKAVKCNADTIFDIYDIPIEIRVDNRGNFING